MAFSDGFDNFARNPNIWLFQAQCHMAAANTLFERYKQTYIKGPLEVRVGCHRAACFLAGMAIENAAKGALIKRDPSIIQNKKINFKDLCGKSGHELLKCTKNAITLSKAEERLLSKLEQYVIWAGKYVLPKNGITLDDEKMVQEMRLSVEDSDWELINELLKRLTKLC